LPVATMPENTVTVPENVLFSTLLIDAITTTTNNQSLELVCKFFCLFNLYFLYNYIFWWIQFLFLCKFLAKINFFFICYENYLWIQFFSSILFI
jgi:hypothetical protein